MKNTKMAALTVVTALTLSLAAPTVAMANETAPTESEPTMQSRSGSAVASNIPIESDRNRPSFQTVQQRILKDTNDARIAVGLKPLTLSTRVSTVATNWSQVQANDWEMKHNPNYRNQIPAGHNGAGENVAFGYNHEAVTQKAWIESPGHYRNMTYPDYTHIGIGVAYTDTGVAYYTQVFAIYKFNPDEDQPVQPPAPVKPTKVDSNRIAGADRYDTSTKVLEQYKNPVDTIYITTGTNFPDALSVSGIAGKEKAPVVITQRNGLTASQLNNIKRLQPKKIYIIGGEDAVGPNVLTQLKTALPKATQKRIAGADRYETAIKVIDELWQGQIGTIYLTTGANFPDALAAAPAAIKENGVVLPVHGHTPTKAVLDLLKKKQAKNIKIIGGPTAVSNEYARILTNNGYRITPIAGTDRYDTANKIAQSAFNTKTDNAYIATGTNFPDALSIAALAGANNAPLLLVPNTCMLPGTKKYIDDAWVRTITVIGDTNAVSNAVKNNLKTC